MLLEELMEVILALKVVGELAPSDLVERTLMDTTARWDEGLTCQRSSINLLLVCRH